MTSQRDNIGNDYTERQGEKKEMTTQRGRTKKSKMTTQRGRAKKNNKTNPKKPALCFAGLTTLIKIHVYHIRKTEFSY